MKVTITLRDLPDGTVNIAFKQHGARRPGGAGAEGMANSIVKGLKMARDYQTKHAAGDTPPAVADAQAVIA